MAITPQAGWIVDPNNPNAVIQAPTGSNATRNLQLQSGDSAAILRAGNTQSQQVSSSVPNPSAKFGELLTGLLSKYQQLGTKGFAEQGFAAKQSQYNRIAQEAPAALQGAAPNVQNSVRAASAGALDPTIQGAADSQQTFGEQIRGFGDLINNARQFAKDYESSQNALKAEARDNLLLAVQLGGAEGLDAIKKENPNIFKIAGLDEETLVSAARSKQAYERSLERAKLDKDKADTLALGTAQKTAVNNLDAVLTSLTSYRNLYDSLVGESGANLFGSDAGSLSGAYNALLFQIAQAAGTGALQAADREVVEAMIPNPTSIRGGVGGAVRGGKQGGLNAIDEAAKIFQNKLAAIQSTTTNSPTTGGTIRVRRKSDGVTGTIPVNEFNSNLYDRL